MPTLTNTTTMPVSWQIGRWPSAHRRELVRICAIASRAAGLCSTLVRAAHGADEIGRVVVGNVLQGVGDARNDIIFADHGHGGFVLQRRTGPQIYQVAGGRG